MTATFRAGRGSFRAWALLLPAIVLSSSCSSGGLVPVTGQVLYKSKPIKGAAVFLHPVPDDVRAQRPSGVTDEDGTFSLTTGKEKGAPPGRYVVTIVWHKEQPPSGKISAAGPPDPVDQLKGRYADAARSTIKVEIERGSGRLEPFELE